MSEYECSTQSANCLSNILSPDAMFCDSKFSPSADEVLKANMDLEKLQQELAARVEKHDAIQNEV